MNNKIKKLVNIHCPPHFSFLISPFSFLFLSLALALPAAADTYYVSASGDDSAAGTEANPFATIGRAFSVIDGTGSVKLLTDIDMGPEGQAHVKAGANVTLDFNGKKVVQTTATNSQAFDYEGDGGSLTFDDSGTGGGITVMGTGTDSVNHACYVVYCSHNCDLTVNGGTFVATSGVARARLFYKWGNGTWTFNKGTYVAKSVGEWTGFIYYQYASGKTVVNDGTFFVEAKGGNGYGIYNEDTSEEIAIHGGDWDIRGTTWVSAFVCAGGTMDINGGTFSATCDGDYIYGVASWNDGDLTIAGGTFAVTNTTGNYAATVASFNPSTCVIKGNPTFVLATCLNPDGWSCAVETEGYVDFSAYMGSMLGILNAYACTYNPGEPYEFVAIPYVTGDMSKFDLVESWIEAGYYSTRPYDATVQYGLLPIVNVEAATKAAYPWTIGSAVAEVVPDSGTNYTTIASAFAAAANGQTVKLLRDIKENVSITTTMSNTFDLAGHVLRGAAGSSVISVVGDLTVIDSVGTGAITTGGAAGNAYAGGIYTSGRLTLLGGAVTNCVGTTRAGGVYVSAGTFTVGGTAKVYGNFVNSKPNNVYLLKGKKMVVSTTTPLASGAKIGVATEAVPTATSWVPVTDTNDGDYSQYFSSDAGYVVVNDANVVKLAAFAAKLTPYDGTARPTSGQFTYDVKSGYNYVTQYGTYKGVLVVEGGVSNYYYETLQMAIAAAKAGAVNTGYCSEANPNGCFKEGTPYDYANNDSLNPNLGKYTDTVTLCANATMIVNRGSGDSPTANYGVRKGIIIDMNGYSVTGTPGYFGFAAGEIPAGQVLVYCNGTALASAYDQDIFDDEGGTGYRAGEIVFANMNMRGQIWPANHSFVFLNGTYDIKLGHTEASPEDPKNLQLRGGYYMRDPTVYKIDYTDCHVELASKDPTIAPYFCRIVKGGTQMKITFMANRTDATLGGQPFVSTNKWITYGRVADIPRPEVEGLAVIGWSKTEGAKEVQYTFEQVATLSTEHGSEFTLYAVWGAVVRIPVFVALDGLGVVPADGRTYEFSITNGNVTTPLQPCCTNLTLACPAGTGDVYRVGFSTNDVTNPWTLALGTGTYIYDIRQKTVARPGEQLAEGTWRTCVKVDLLTKPYVTLTNNEYLDAIDDLSEGAFKAYENSGTASFSPEGRYIVLGSDTQTVYRNDAFNRGLVKSNFAFDFTRSFRVDGTMQVGNAADGTAIGFVPNGEDLNTSSDFSGEGSALGCYQCAKNGYGLFLEFDTLGDGSGWGGQTDYIGNTAHFVLTTTDKNGNPSNVKGQNVVFEDNYALPSEVMSYSIDYDSFSKEMLFTIKTTTQIWKLAYTNPPAVFGGMKAYMTLSGAMRYGPEYEYGCGEEGSPAPKTKITIATFNYVNDSMTGAVENTFRNRQEALVTYDANGGMIGVGATAVEKTEAFANAGRYDTPVDPERTDYDFLGWYTSWTNGTDTVEARRGEMLSPIADRTVYAKWASKAIDPGEGDKTLKTSPAVDEDGNPIPGAAAVDCATNELKQTDFAIPEMTDNGTGAGAQPIVQIKEFSFCAANYDRKYPGQELTSVTIPTYVREIQPFAFEGCTRLSNVTFSVTRDYETREIRPLIVDDWAFDGSSVTELVFPADSKVILGKNCFSDAKNLTDIYILGTVEVAGQYPFRHIGENLPTGTKVKVHLSPTLAADAKYVYSLTNGMDYAHVEIDQGIEGKVELVGTPDLVNDPMTFTFRLETDSPWLKVTESSVYLFYSTTLAPDVFVGTKNVIYPVAGSLVPNGDDTWTANFAKPAAPAGTTSAYFQLCVGAERQGE